MNTKTERATPIIPDSSWATEENVELLLATIELDMLNLTKLKSALSHLHRLREEWDKGMVLIECTDCKKTDRTKYIFILDEVNRYCQSCLKERLLKDLI